jgi:hypothetical protein
MLASAALLTRELQAQYGDEPPPEWVVQPPADDFAKSPRGEPPEPERPSAAAPAPPATLAPGPPPATPAAVGVELLAAEAFPAAQTAGIPGGSLSSTAQQLNGLQLHGLQWPYLPARPGSARTRLALSGAAWVDGSYRHLESGSPDQPELAEWEQKGRFVLRATPTLGAPGDWFVQGAGELVLLGSTPALAQESLGVDDLYVRAGKWNAFDITAGRFQGWEVFHLGMGLEQHTTERLGASTALRPALEVGTDLQFLWARRDGAGNLALHLYPLSFLRFELLGSFGGDPVRNELGARPAAILDFGLIKAKVAADYRRESPRERQPGLEARTLSRGVVGALQVVVAPLLEAGVAGGYALVDDYDAQGVLNAARSHTTYGFGGFANVRIIEAVVLGVGGVRMHQRNLETDETGTLNDVEAHTQLFGAAQYALWERLYIKAVFAYASALFDPQSDPMPATFRNESLSGRIRLSYGF